MYKSRHRSIPLNSAASCRDGREVTIKKAFDTVSTILVAAAAALLIWTLVEERWDRSGRSAAGQQMEDVVGLTIEARQVRRTKGAGPIALIEFTDYECQFCAAHARDISPQIDEKLVDTGAIRHIVFNYPLERIHPAARRASEAAECAARQQRYWEMHDRLFRDFKSLGPSGVVRLGDAIGLDPEAFGQCLAGEAADAIAADLAEGRRLGVTGTPTFFVGVVRANGSIQLVKRLYGVRPFEDFQNAVDAVSAIRLR